MSYSSSDTSSLFLSTSFSAVRCRLHPVVLFSVLDHFVRRNEGQERVIGTLMGVTASDGTIEIRNSFPVPHNETEQVTVDSSFHKNMISLHKKANPDEVIVGWYATGAGIDKNSVTIHDIYTRLMYQAAPLGVAVSPIHLLVDTDLTRTAKMGIRAFVSSNLSFTSTSEKPLSVAFQPVQLDISTQGAERAGLDILLKSKESPQGAFLSELDSLERAVTKLQQLLDVSYDYVDSVAEGRRKGDVQIGRYLSETVSSVPRFNQAAFEKLLNSSLLDLLMVVYLSNLTRAQLALVERLQGATS